MRKGNFCLLLLVFTASSIFADIIYPYIDSDTGTITYTGIPVYSLLRWNYHFNRNNVTVIDLQIDQSVFNYCDLSQFTKEGVLPLMLTYYNITEEDINSGLVWVALWISAPTSCDYSTMTLKDRYILYWDDTISPFIQSTGAVGFIDFYITIPYYALWNLDFVDKSKGRAFGLDGSKVFGGSVLSSYQDDFYSAKEAFENLTKPFIISIQDSPDPQVDVWVSPIGPFYYFYRAANFLSVIFCIYSLMTILHVVLLLLHVKKGSDRWGFSAVALGCAVFGTVCRLILSIDPDTVYCILPHIANTVLSSLSFTLHIATTIASIIVWIDTIIGVAAAAKMRVRKPTYSRNNGIKFLFLLLLITLVILDPINSIAANVLGIYVLNTVSVSSGELGYLFTIDSEFVIENSLLVLLLLTELVIAIIVRLTGRRLNSIRDDVAPAALISPAGDENNKLPMIQTHTSTYANTGRGTKIPRQREITNDNYKTLSIGERTNIKVNPISNSNNIIIKSTAARSDKTQINYRNTRAVSEYETMTTSVQVKMNSLSLYMLLSAAFIVILVVLDVLYFLFYEVYYEDFSFSFEYYFLETFPFLLIQISTVFEVMAIKETLIKRR